MARSFFDHTAPLGVRVYQRFKSRPAENGYHTVYEAEFTALCRCRVGSTPRATRADALQEIDGHVCHVAVGS